MILSTKFECPFCRLQDGVGADYLYVKNQLVLIQDRAVHCGLCGSYLGERNVLQVSKSISSLLSMLVIRSGFRLQRINSGPYPGSTLDQLDPIGWIYLDHRAITGAGLLIDWVSDGVMEQFDFNIPKVEIDWSALSIAGAAFKMAVQSMVVDGFQPIESRIGERDGCLRFRRVQPEENGAGKAVVRAELKWGRPGSAFSLTASRSEMHQKQS